MSILGGCVIMRWDLNGQGNAQLEENGINCVFKVVFKVVFNDYPLIRLISLDWKRSQGPGRGPKTFNNSGIDTRSKPAGPLAEGRFSTTTDL